MRPLTAACLLALILLIAPVGPGGAFPARGAPQPTNSVQKDGFEITITVPIDLHQHGTGRYRVRGLGVIDTAQLAEWWESGAESIWNQGLQRFDYRGCYTFQIDLQINAVEASPFSGDSDHHQIYLKPTHFFANVNRGGRRPPVQDDDNTYSHPAVGYWGRIGPDTVAHEVGHLLGLADDYVKNRDSNGKVTGETSKPGREGTLMSIHHGGSVATWFDQELVDRLGDMASIHVDMPPCFLGEVTIIQEDEVGAGHTRTAVLDLTVGVLPSDDGLSDGTAAGTFALDGRVAQDGCEFTYSTGADVQLDLGLEGPANGPYRLIALQTQPVQESQTHQLCNTRVVLDIDWEVGLTLGEIVFQDGRYEFADDTTDIILYYFER